MRLGGAPRASPSRPWPSSRDSRWAKPSGAASITNGTNTTLHTIDVYPEGWPSNPRPAQTTEVPCAGWGALRFCTVERDGQDVVVGDPGTQLHLSRIGRPGEHAVEIDEGWVTFLEQLRYVISEQPRGARHTFMVAGAPATGIPWDHQEWTRSAHQRTVVVPEWDPSAGGPAARVVVNGYGHTDEVAAEHHAAVAAWMSSSG